MKDYRLLIIGVVVIAAGLLFVSSPGCGCGKKTAPAAKETTQVTQKYVAGTPVVTIEKKPVHATTALVKKDSTGNEEIFTGTVKDSLIDATIAVKIDSSGNYTAELIGYVLKEKERQVDSVYTEITKTIIPDTPWYSSPLAIVCYTVSGIVVLTLTIMSLIH